MKFAFKLFGIVCVVTYCNGHHFKELLCDSALSCRHNYNRICATEPHKEKPRWFKDICYMLEYNCEFETTIVCQRGCLSNEHITEAFWDIYTYTNSYSKSPEALDSFEFESKEEAYAMSTAHKIKVILFICYLTSLVACHGPPSDRDSEDIAMGRKMSNKWCSMAKVCNHDRVPICGLSHAGDVMGFRDLCDMFDYNCIRRRNYKQTSCPADRGFLTASRKPTNSFYDE